MRRAKLVRCFLFLGMFVTMEFVNGQLSATTKTQMRLGVKDLQSTLDYGATLLEKIKPMAGALGIFGAFFTFVMLFVPSKESAEMNFMRQEFAQINTKLDKISSEIDNVKTLVKLETQRAQYVTSEKKILFAYDELNKFQDEISASSSCSSEQACKKERLLIASKYVGSFNIRENLYEIMRGTSGPWTVFSDSLLELINNHFHCDINKVYDFASGVIMLAFKGQHVVLAHEKLTGTNYSIASVMKEWSIMAYNIRMKADDIRSRCYDNIRKYIEADVKDNIYQTGFQTNKEAAFALKKFLDDKYPWVLWTILSYEAHGAENHYGYQPFINMPKEGRKWVLRVIGSDNGTYTSQFETSEFIQRVIKKKY